MITIAFRSAIYNLKPTLESQDFSIKIKDLENNSRINIIFKIYDLLFIGKEKLLFMLC